MNTENNEFDEDFHTQDTEPVVPPTQEEIEYEAHKKAFLHALNWDEVERGEGAQNKKIEKYEISKSGREALLKLTSSNSILMREFTYAKAANLFYAIAKLSNENIVINRDKDDSEKKHGDKIYRLNIDPQLARDAKDLICVSVSSKNSFLSWGLQRPSKVNPFAATPLFVHVGNVS